MAERIEHLVSTVIPVYNRAALLADAVASVLAQTYRPIEILIVDDGSSDGTTAVAQALAEEHPDLVRFVRQENRGPGPARETGRQLARGEYLQYLDSDDRLHPQKFERQVALLDARPEVDIVYGITQLIDADGIVLDELLKWSGESRCALYPGLLVDRWWSTHTPLWRSEFCDRIGPWSDLRYSEDWEYEARAGALGARLDSVQTVVSFHRSHCGARETTSGRWLSFSDQVCFFEALYAGAAQAGVPADAPEMRHFVRWVFAVARAAGAARDAASAQQLLALAKRAVGGHSPDITAYQLAATVVGWRVADALLKAVLRLLGRNAGSKTRPQSWMEVPDGR